jgi:hypothetical protein
MLNTWTCHTSAHTSCGEWSSLVPGAVTSLLCNICTPHMKKIAETGEPADPGGNVLLSRSASGREISPAFTVWRQPTNMGRRRLTLL